LRRLDRWRDLQLSSEGCLFRLLSLLFLGFSFMALAIDMLLHFLGLGEVDFFVAGETPKSPF
jgi:hypothetical protein